MLKMEEFRKVHVQVIGAEDTYGENAAKGDVSLEPLSLSFEVQYMYWDCFDN